MPNNKRGVKYLGTPFQNKLLFLVLASAIIPTTIVAICLYYFIFNLLARQMAIPEAIAYNIMPVLQKVNIIIILTLPVVLAIIWFVALELSHRIAGPLYRIERELDEILAGKRHGPIKLRKNDEFKALVEKINRIVYK